ncbi:MAG: hypothetical protein ACJ0GY_05985 [Synechococcus sp.]
MKELLAMHVQLALLRRHCEISIMLRTVRIKLALIDYFRRATNEFIPEKGLHKIWTLVKEVHGYIGDSKLAEEFEQLSSLDYGTLGKTIHTFYRARGFKFPGEPGNLTETAVRHDCVHILSGTNTDMAGEIAVSAIESGMANSEVGWEMISERASLCLLILAALPRDELSSTGTQSWFYVLLFRHLLSVA